MRSAVLLPAFMAALLWSPGCGDGEAETPAKDNGGRTVTVSVRVMQPTPFAEAILLTGTVKASDDVLITPEEGGTVRTWNAERGSWVEAGSVIVELADDVLRPGYETALAQYNTAELNYRKQEQVFQEQAVSELQVRSAQYARDAAKAQADLAKARYERSRIKAPVAGILDERFVDEGEMATPGVPIARVVNTARLKLVVNVPERFAGRVRTGTPVEFTVGAYGDEVFRGRVTFVGTAISPDNRTFQIEAVLGNPGGRLKPEMIARVRLVQSAREKALVLPEEVVQRVDRDRLVVYLEENGIARERVVQTGGRASDSVEIVSGLKAGDRVIVSGYRNLADGQSVTVME